METKKLTMEEIIAMCETVENQISISKQEEARAALEAKYNNAEEAVEQDSLRAQIDRVDEIFEEDIVEENNVEEDNLDDWSSVDDNSYYDDNLDMDQ